MKYNLTADGVTRQETVVENPGAIGMDERFFAPFRAAFLKLTCLLNRQTADRHCLQLAVFAVNSTIGPEGLCLTLLEFEVLPHTYYEYFLRRNSPGPRTSKRV